MKKSVNKKCKFTLFNLYKGKKKYINIYMESERSFYCEICEKNYKSIQSLSNHKRKFHPKNIKKSSNITQNQGKSLKKSSNITQNQGDNTQNTSKIICEFCNKSYTRKDNLKRHLTKCKKKDSFELIKKENEIMKKELLKLMNKKCKIHPNTLKKICRDNGIMIDNSNINSHNTNNITNNNNTVNNNTINIIGFGFEGMDIDKTLTKKEKIKILKYGGSSLYKFVEYIHFNDKYPQYQNIAITNLNNPYAYKYDSRKQKFIACLKDELLDELIDTRILDIDEFYNIYGNKIDDNKKIAIENLIKEMNEDEETERYQYIKKKLKILIYNSKNPLELNE